MKKPKYDAREGTLALISARLYIIGFLCAFQYWMFCITMEAYHFSKTNIVLISAIASACCFLLSLYILITGERFKD